jgi:hypothetical protein
MDTTRQFRLGDLRGAVRLRRGGVAMRLRRGDVRCTAARLRCNDSRCTAWRLCRSSVKGVATRFR